MKNLDHEVTNQLRALREDIIDALSGLAERARAFELAEPPGELEQYRLKLEENAYKVLVVGEAKRGKSSFVNALIGRDVLPTDVENATTQVFNVRHADNEDFRLRFEDGSTQRISERDLPRYGFQTDGNVVLRLERIIRWIEVDVPIRFLPEGVSVLDTPGLGALDAAHAQITQRFLPRADAVIYVLDSERPVAQTDLEYIEAILHVTSSIFFVQTMVDKYGSETWEARRHRNREILEQRFGDRLPDTRIWPISNEHLRKAATTDRYADAYLEMSHYRELREALQAFLNGVVGCGESAQALLLMAERYHAQSRETLSARLTGVEDPRQARAESSRRTELQQQFNRDWAPQGKKRRQLTEELQRAIDLGNRSFVEALGPGGDIEFAQEAKIDAVASFADARKVGENMVDDVVGRVLDRWNRECKQVQSRFIELLSPFVEDGQVLTPLTLDVSSDLSVDEDRLTTKFKVDVIKALRGAGVIMTISMVAGAAGASALLAIPALLLAANGLRDAIEIQRKTARQDLHKNLKLILQQVRKHFRGTDAAGGRYSLVEEYFKELKRSVDDQVQAVVNRKNREHRREIELLTEGDKLDVKEREAKAEQIRQQLTEWEEVGKVIEGVAARLAALNQSPAMLSMGHFGTER